MTQELFLSLPLGLSLLPLRITHVALGPWSSGLVSGEEVELHCGFWGAWLLIHHLSHLLIRGVCTFGALTPGKSRGEGVGDRASGEMWACGDTTVSEPAKGAGASQGFWGKGGAQARMPEGPPSWRQDRMVKCKEKGAGGQRDDCGWDVFTEGR